MLLRIADMAVGPLTLNLPDFGGRFSIDPSSRLFARLAIDGNYEPWSSRLLDEFIARDGDVIDVGANIGFYVVASARRVSAGSRVVAVECNPEALVLLRENISRNGLDAEVVVIEKACSDVAGAHVELNCFDGKSEFSTIGNRAHPAAKGHSRKVMVETTTLDQIVSETGVCPVFIKIDVEGVEHLVLDGARRVLKKYKPTVLCEVSDLMLKEMGSSWEEVVESMAKLGYSARSVRAPALPAKRLATDLLFVAK